MRARITAAERAPRGVALVATLFAASCTAELVASEPTPRDVDEPTRPAARSAFDETVLPALDARCRFCHGDPAMAPAFLLGEPDVYTTVMAWPSLVDLDDPAQSRLLTKGDHDGPPWSESEAATILSWLRLEEQAAHGGGGPALATAITPIAAGDNAIDLAPLGLPGTTVTFVAAFSAAGLELDLLEVRAGADGAHVVDPSFVPYLDGSPAETLTGRLDGVDVAVAPHEASALGDGALSLAGLDGQASLALSFALAEPAPDAAPAPAAAGADPCARLEAFTRLAAPPLADRCASCHGGDDAAATATLDLRGIADASASGQAAVCQRVRASVDPDRALYSALFTEVSPLLDEEHPFHFGGDYAEFRTFRTAVLQWLTGREDAP